MSYRFVRTPAGQAEIQSRSLNLARHVRNLLLIINASQPADYWLAQVKGCDEADLFRLVAEGLIERADEPVTRPAVASGDDEYHALQQRVRQMAYAPLYEALNSFGKEILGLLGGYRFALEVERCNGPQELQALGLKFLEQLRADHGPTGLRRFAQKLDSVSAG